MVASTALPRIPACRMRHELPSKANKALMICPQDLSLQFWPQSPLSLLQGPPTPPPCSGCPDTRATRGFSDTRVLSASESSSECHSLFLKCLCLFLVSCSSSSVASLQIPLPDNPKVCLFPRCIPDPWRCPGITSILCIPWCPSSRHGAPGSARDPIRVTFVSPEPSIDAFHPLAWYVFAHIKINKAVFQESGSFWE